MKVSKLLSEYQFPSHLDTLTTQLGITNYERVIVSKLQHILLTGLVAPTRLGPPPPSGQAPGPVSGVPTNNANTNTQTETATNILTGILSVVLTQILLC